MQSQFRSTIRSPQLIVAASLFIFMTFFLTSCSDDPVTPEVTEGINEFVNSIATFSDPPAENTGEHILKSAHVDSTVEPGVGHFVCQVSEYRMDKNLHETTVFNVNDVSLWPGALVRGGDLDKGLLNPIVAGRAGLVVGTDLAGLTFEQGTRTVAEPNHLEVQGALNEIVTTYLATSGGAIGAKLSFDETYVEEFSQSMLDLSVSMSWWSWGNGSLQTDFASSNEKRETSYLCRFSQAYYTASVVPPANPAAVFASNVVVGDLNAYMSEDDPPCYVSSVTYGRVGFLSIHSYAQRDSVAMAVKAAFDGMGWDMESDMNAEFQQILNTSEIKILVRGGDASDGVLPILGDPIQGMRDWIESGANLNAASDAVPISYTTRYLKDNRLAAFAYGCEWVVEDCEPATLFFQVAVPRLYCVAADDGWFDDTLEVYYLFDLEYEFFAGADLVIERIFTRTSGNPVSMGIGGEHLMPEAWRNVWMPEAAGARFRLRISVTEWDAATDDRIGDFHTDWYEWPDWRGAGSCAYPAGFPQLGGEPATCSKHMMDDSGTDVIAYWEISTPVPTKDW